MDSSHRTILPVTLVAIVGLTLGAASGHAACDPTTDPDRSDVRNARAAVAASCDCATAITHGSYVRCAVQQANLTLVNKSCAGAVKRCASRSTCGKRPGTVTCCLSKGLDTTCKIRGDAGHCRAPGFSACVGNYASCCDACGAGGCSVTTTTSTITATTSTTTSSTTTTTIFIPFVPCTGGSGAPTCDGTCDAGLQCGLYYDASQPGPGTCACFPVGAIPCTTALFPQCGGACPDGRACGAFQSFDPNAGFLSVCACIDPAQQCGKDASGACRGGYCPGAACLYTPIAPHAQCPCCGCGTPVGG